MDNKLNYQAPESQVVNVEFENSILSGENSVGRQSYGDAEEI